MLRSVNIYFSSIYVPTFEFTAVTFPKTKPEFLLFLLCNCLRCPRGSGVPGLFYESTSKSEKTAHLLCLIQTKVQHWLASKYLRPFPFLENPNTPSVPTHPAVPERLKILNLVLQQTLVIGKEDKEITRSLSHEKEKYVKLNSCTSYKELWAQLID